jgi:hypothetical protein
MSHSSNQSEGLERAYLLVGRFQYHFARVEQKVDQAVIKLLDLDDKAGSIVTGSVDFAKKLNFVRTAAYEQAHNGKDQKFGEDTCNGVFAINTDRQLVIHSSFEPAPDGGVQFRKTVAKDGRVRIDDQVWTDKEFSQRYEKMAALETDLNSLILLIKPLPPFDWYVPFQDMYHRSSSGIVRTAAISKMNELAEAPRPPDQGKT